MAEKVISRIEFEIEQIDHLFDSYADLLDQVRKQRPDLVQTTAIASVLHSFYNGLENIFATVAKSIDANMPASPQWHRDLLTQITESTNDRPSVLTPKTATRLADYLAFRHFYRHSYSFFLSWNELEGLVMSLDDVWAQVKYELQQFLNLLSTEEKE